MADSPALIPPKPPWIKEVIQPIEVRKLSERDFSDRGDTAARHAGVLYEKKARAKLRELLPGISCSLWWDFYDQRSRRAIQTDAVYFAKLDTIITIFEIKKSFTSDAWWQLRKVYEPVIQAWAGASYINVVEVCSSFDPVVVMPEEIEVIENLPLWVKERNSRMGVFVCRP